MEIIKDYIPITKAKADLLNLIRRLEDTDEAVAITKKGVPEAVLLSIGKFRGLLETIEILSDYQAMKSIRKSMREAGEGKWISLEDVFGK